MNDAEIRWRELDIFRESLAARFLDLLDFDARCAVVEPTTPMALRAAWLDQRWEELEAFVQKRIERGRRLR